MDDVLLAYALYLVVSLGLMVWVGRTLFNNGRLFLVRVFNDDGAFADSVNQLLLVGFYLVNFGFIIQNLVTHREVASMRVAVELMADKVGMVTLVLGGMHFGNLYIFSRIWRKLGSTMATHAVSAPNTPAAVTR